MYVLLHGFDDPNIIMLLNDIGVYVDVVVKIQTQDYSVFPVVSRNPDKLRYDHLATQGFT